MSDTLHIVAASGASQSVDVSVADVWDITLTANCTLSLIGAAIGSAFTVALLLRQDGTGGRTVTWPGSVSWPAGAAPTLHSGAADLTLVTLTTVDGGSTWVGFAEPADGATGATGTAGADGTDGVDGADGGAIAIEYTFSTMLTDSDPGNGNLRLSASVQNTSLTIRTDLLDLNGADWTTILDSFDDSTNTVKGFIRLYKKSDPTKFLVFSVSAVAAPTGYRNITVSNIGSSASSPFADGDAIVLCFDRAGDQGSAAGSPLTTKGDIYVHSSSDTRLPVGSDGQALVADSSQPTGLAWKTGASVRVFDSTLGADAASIDTGAGAIPAGYDVLEIFVIARTDDAGAGSVVDLILNNDTTSIYDRQNLTGANTTASAAEANADASWRISAHGSGGSASYPAVFRLTIPGYAQTTFWKVAELTYSTPDATAANQQAGHRGLGYRSTSAISRVKLAAEGTAKLKAGSRLLIYAR